MGEERFAVLKRCSVGPCWDLDSKGVRTLSSMGWRGAGVVSEGGLFGAGGCRSWGEIEIENAEIDGWVEVGGKAASAEGIGGDD